jgi:hypothetical protein
LTLLGVEWVTLAEIDGGSPLEDGIVVHRNIYTGKTAEITDIGLLTYATPRAPDLRGFDVAEIAAAGPRVHVIGDAYAPGATMAATSQGHRLGNSL